MQLFEMEDVQKQIPIETIKTAEGVTTLRRYWGRAFCFVAGRRMPSMHVSNADEVNTSAFHRQQTYQFAYSRSRIDVALHVLNYVRWSPECSNLWQLDAQKLLPPAFTHNHSDLRSGRDTREENAALNARVGVSVIDRIGVTVCLISSGGYTPYSSLCIHGRIITEDPLLCLQEAAVLHGLGALHG